MAESVVKVMSSAVAGEGGGPTYLSALMPALYHIDKILDLAVRCMEPLAAADGSPSFRGLYIGRDEIARLLAKKPAATPFEAMFAAASNGNGNGYANENSPLFWLIREFGLSSFDADVLLLCLAPEIDLRYEKIYAYLQDDVTRKWPTVELILNLLCSSAEMKLSRRVHLSPHAPLLRNALIHVAPDANQPEAPFLAHSVHADEQIVRLLLGQAGLDPRLAYSCELIAPLPDASRVPGESGGLVPVLARLAQRSPDGTLRAYFQGPAENEKFQVAEALAEKLGVYLLRARAPRLAEKPDADSLFQLLLREARVNNAILYISDIDSLEGAEGLGKRQRLFEQLKNHAGITLLAGRRTWALQAFDDLSLIPIDFEAPEYQARVSLWTHGIEQSGFSADAKTVRALAGRFNLTSGQIAQAARSATLAAEWRAAGESIQDGGAIPSQEVSLTLQDLAAAARSQCGRELSTLARKIEPKYKWDDVVLPPDQVEQLREICAQAEHRHVVYDEWGFDRKLSLGKGLNVLFCGPPGTGKSMSAEVIARELDLDLYRIDLSQVVSKYIGETEKNLNRIFNAAESSNGILFFDEADALFGKRSEVHDSHDRYANIEISYLLQKMEEYEKGICILATNLRQNLDDAFIRRLQFIVEFPFPDEEYRRKIWQTVFPKETPLAPDADFALLANEIRLAGGNIKNMALAAAFYAAAAQESVGMGHLVQAAHREHQKLGRSWSSSLGLGVARGATH